MVSRPQPSLTIFFQLDPFNPTIGGIQTCIKSVLKYAPSQFRIRLVGILHGASANPSTVGTWQTLRLQEREFDFLPLLKIADDNVRGVIPTTVKYALALRKYLSRQPIMSDFYQFHRIEPTWFTRQLSGTKLLYIHNDIQQEVGGKAKGGILWKRFPWAYFALEGRLVRQFDRILSCNQESTRLYQQRYPEIAERVSYLKNTFDSELFYPLSAAQKNLAREQLAQQLGLSPQTQFILFAGRLHPQKQPILLIQTMAQLKQQLKRPDVHLLIVGKGELEKALQDEIDRLGMQAQITLMGALSQGKLAELYRSCALYVLTSAYEGLARGSLEALACGTPVVTTRAGETPQFLTIDSGIVCEQNTPEALAQAWQQVLEHPANFLSESCVRVAQPYEARLVVETLYGELLEDWQRTGEKPFSSKPSAFADATQRRL
jgi:glycosyltransferase involved in cell wall biosynthesis